MAKSVVTPERFAKGRTFDQYMGYVGSPENLAREAFGSYYADGGSISAARKDNSAVFRERYARVRLTDQQVAAIEQIGHAAQRRRRAATENRVHCREQAGFERT